MDFPLGCPIEKLPGRSSALAADESVVEEPAFGDKDEAQLTSQRKVQIQRPILHEQQEKVDMISLLLGKATSPLFGHPYRSTLRLSAADTAVAVAGGTFASLAVVVAAAVDDAVVAAAGDGDC